MYNCDLTITESMPEQTHDPALLSKKHIATRLTEAHYDEIAQWRIVNLRGVVQPFFKFLAQKGMEHIMSIELISSPLSIRISLSQIDPTDGRSPSERPRLMQLVPDIHAHPNFSYPFFCMCRTRSYSFGMLHRLMCSRRSWRGQAISWVADNEWMMCWACW